MQSVSYIYEQHNLDKRHINKKLETVLEKNIIWLNPNESFIQITFRNYQNESSK